MEHIEQIFHAFPLELIIQYPCDIIILCENVIFTLGKSLPLGKYCISHWISRLPFVTGSSWCLFQAKQNTERIIL